MYIRNDLPGKDEPIPSKGNDDNLEDQEGEEALWRHDIKKGWIRKRAVYIYFISIAGSVWLASSGVGRSV